MKGNFNLSLEYLGRDEPVPVKTLVRFYREGIWDSLNCDSLPAGLDYFAFDSAVVVGVETVKNWLELSKYEADVTERLIQLENLRRRRLRSEGNPQALVNRITRARVRALEMVDTLNVR